MVNNQYCKFFPPVAPIICLLSQFLTQFPCCKFLGTPQAEPEKIFGSEQGNEEREGRV